MWCEQSLVCLRNDVNFSGYLSLQGDTNILDNVKFYKLKNLFYLKQNSGREEPAEQPEGE